MCSRLNIVWIWFITALMLRSRAKCSRSGSGESSNAAASTELIPRRTSPAGLGRRLKERGGEDRGQPGSTNTGTGLCRMIFVAREPRNTRLAPPRGDVPRARISPSCQSATPKT